MLLPDVIDSVAADTGFAGVVSVDRGGEVEFARAYGLASRANQVPNTIDTRFAIASGVKGLTALTVISLIERDALSLATTARSMLDTDLPLIGDDVTIEHLLAHRSGIGDYLDEETSDDINDYALTVPAQELATTEQYLAVLDGHPAKFAPGERFSYCNAGYVVLALIAERVSGTPFPDLLRDRVTIPAGMRDTEFLRSDELPGRTAIGYLPIDGRLRTNVFHLPVLGSGDGGIYSTAADITALWQSLFAERIVSAPWVAEMVYPRSTVCGLPSADRTAGVGQRRDVPAERRRYGLGFWLHQSTGTLMLEGYDAGVSFRTVHDPASHLTHTVLSNSSDGAWPVTARLDELLDI